MSDLTEKNKHMTQDDRTEIQECLSKGMSFKAIGRRIGKDQTTVSKEVKKHLVYSPCKVVHRDKTGNEIPPPTCPKLLKPPFVCNPCEKSGTVAFIKNRNTLPKMRSANTNLCLLRHARAYR